MRRRSLVVLTLVSLAIASLLLVWLASPDELLKEVDARSRSTARAVAATTTASVSASVDFASPIKPPSMSGFLHSLDTPTPSALISPLKPAWWRLEPGDVNLYRQATAYGATVQLVISDSYGYPMDNWRGHGPPWENGWKNWEDHVRKTARLYKGLPVYWDVWNEPDERDWNRATFWNGTRAQFFEAYKRAYTVLRQELGPNAIIGGPSFANYEQADLEAFLAYCQQNALQVNFLSWHELWDPEENIPSVADHLRYMRKLAASYPGLKITKIFINEVVGQKNQYHPGAVLGYLYYLEDGGADGANKACWDASDKTQNCFNGSLNGIINAKTKQPRAAWWVYNYYAAGIDSRVKAISANKNLVVMASKAPRQLLVTYLGKSIASTMKANITLQNLSTLGVKTATLKASIYRIPATGEKVLKAPTLMSSQTLKVTNGSAVLVLSGLKPNEAYQVVF